MCIRDSDEAEREHYRKQFGKTTKFWNVYEKKGDEPGYFGTVSYTHLRAHETVLDLVCRLLLEKKKTAKQKENIRLRHLNRGIRVMTAAELTRRQR